MPSATMIDTNTSMSTANKVSASERPERVLSFCLIFMPSIASRHIGDHRFGSSYNNILFILDGDTFLDALAHIGTFEFVEVVNLTWAMAKTADEDLPDPKTWAREFDTFPVDVVAPELIGLIIGGLTSSKNLRRLEELKKKLRPESTSTPLSSQDLNED